MKLNNCQFRVIYHKDFPMFRPTEIVYGKAEFIDKIEQAVAKMTAAKNKDTSFFEAVEKIYAELLKFGFYDFNGDFDVCTLAGEEYPTKFYEKSVITMRTI